MNNDYPRILFIDLIYNSIEINESIGLEVIAEYISSIFNDISIDILTFEEVYNDNKQIDKYDIIGVSTNISVYNQLECVLKMFNKAENKPIVVVGGIYGTYAYRQLLDDYPDVVCSVGEGEASWKGMIHLYISSHGSKSVFYGNLFHVPNLAYKSKGILIETERAIIDLSDILTFPKHRVVTELSLKNGIARIEASRGCPWNKCSFCVLNWKYAHTKWRGYPIIKIINELIYLDKYHVKAVYFTDEEFLGGTYARSKELLDAILSLKETGQISSDMFFAASISAKTLLNHYSTCTKEEMIELLTEMKTVGFRNMFIGIESGSDSQLARFCKGTTNKDNIKALQLINDADISADIGYIIFDPYVTVEELLESLLFIRDNGLRGHMSRFAKRLRLVPNTSYCDAYISHISESDFNIDAIEYSYEFANMDVAKIYKIYSKWEKQHLSDTLSLQSVVRGTSYCDQLYKALSELSYLRMTEYDALFHIVSSVIDAKNKLKKEYEMYINNLKFDDFFVKGDFMENKEYLDLVDENDMVVGKAERSFIYKSNMHCYRVIGIFLRTQDGKLIIPRRSMNCKLFPGCFDFSVAGHVSSGETYEEAAYREAKEELGIDAKDLSLHEYLYVKYPNDLGLSSFSKYYYADCPENIILDKDGIDSVEYLSVDKINEMVTESPESFKPDFIPAFSMLRKALL